MTIDEAIRHAEEVAEENYGKATAYFSDREVYKHEEQKCLKCADEHMQLAEWLKDYKRLKEQEPSVSENPNNCDMRDATLEERESIDKYIKSISKPTGVKFGALEQEPSGDLISRVDALASIKNLYPDMPIVDIFRARRKWLEKYAPYFECENAVEQLPSVNPQKPKTGHWITKIKSDLVGDMWPTNPKCSECGGEPYYSNTIYNYKFCPYCGARMESEKNE